MCVGVPMKIKNVDTDMLKYLEDGVTETTETSIPVDEMSLGDDELNLEKRFIKPLVIIPQDGLRYSIISIMTYIISKLVNDYMAKYCSNANTDNDRPCLITMKNEFLVKRALITDAKKHYASKIELQEGNPVPEDKSLDIKGMDAFVKSTFNKHIQEKLKAVLYEDILNTDVVDGITVLKHISDIEKEIYNSIMAGEKRYYKPLQVKSISSYENPMRIQGITSSYVYNALHEPGTEALDLSQRNSVDVVKVDINMKNINAIKETYPYVYEKAVELLGTKEYKTGISAIAIPLSEDVPKWILPFINYAEIIHDNVSGFPIESIGFYRGNKSNNISNIISF